jgi:hypothetical protein
MHFAPTSLAGFLEPVLDRFTVTCSVMARTTWTLARSTRSEAVTAGVATTTQTPNLPMALLYSLSRSRAFSGRQVTTLAGSVK